MALRRLAAIFVMSLAIALLALVVALFTDENDATAPTSLTPLTLQETATPAASPSPQGFVPGVAGGYFVGQIGGITFYDPAVPGTRPTPRICSEPQGESYNSTPEEVAASSLDFKPSYLPAGIVEVRVDGQKCNGVVFRIVKAYAEPNQPPGRLVIRRFAEPLMTPAIYTADRLEATTIAGKPAVIARPPGGANQIYLLVPDAVGYWFLSLLNPPSTSAILTADDLRRIAEGVLD